MLNLFNQIAKVGSPSEKLQMLKDYPYQSELKEVLRLATDPFITFGITTLEGAPQGNADTFDILKKCATRELTGGAARKALGEACLDTEDAALVCRILMKDLRCGVGEKLVLQLYPGLIQQFNVMRADKFSGISPRLKYHIEPKYDGLRCLAIVQGGSVTLLSRNGKEFTSSDHLKPQLLAIAPYDCVFDGELTSGNFNESSSAVRKKAVQNDTTTYNIFDFLDMDEWVNPVSPYYVRRGRLENLFQPQPNLVLTPSLAIQDEDDAIKRYQQYLDFGYEGGIVKNTRGIYRFKRHKDWMKLKEVNDVDLPVKELVQGEGKYYGMLGAVIVHFKNKRVSVGTGFSDEERMAFWDDPSLIKGKVIEIHFHQETPDGSLRHPRFHCIREDKS
jgi:DNA ligase-1